MKKTAKIFVGVVTTVTLFFGLNSFADTNSNQIAQIDVAALNGGVIKSEASLESNVKKGSIVLQLDSSPYTDQLNIDSAKLMDDLQIYNRDNQLDKLHPHAVISDQDLNTARCAVAGDAATVKLDKTYVNQCIVRAPFDGTVTKVLNYPGSGVGSGNEIMDITAA
jgi:multidrug resistance efflux pump